MNPKLKVVQNEPDPARVALAEAIKRRDALAASCMTLTAAIPSASDRVYEARRAHKAAFEELGKTKQAAANHAALVLVQGEGGTAPQTVAAARRKLVDAEDDLEVARQAVGVMEKNLRDDESSLVYANDRVRDAALVVLRSSPGIARLVREVGELMRAIVDKGAAFRWLMDKQIVPVEATRLGQPEAPALTIKGRLASPPTTWNELLASTPGAQPWEDALAALMKNADAEVPA